MPLAVLAVSWLSEVLSPVLLNHDVPVYASVSLPPPPDISPPLLFPPPVLLALLSQTQGLILMHG